MNVIDESYRVGMLLARTPEGRTYFEKKNSIEQCLKEYFGEPAVSLVSHKNLFFEYQILQENLAYQLELPESQRAPFLREAQVKALLADVRFTEAVAYTGRFAVNVEKLIEQIQLRGRFQDISGFTMTPKLRNAGIGLETAYQRTGLYDIELFQKIARDKSYGEQLGAYEQRRQQIGGAVAHYAYSRDARRLMREMEAQGYVMEVIRLSENLYLLKDLMEEAIYESFFGGRVTIASEDIQKYRKKELERGFGILALWTEWKPELITARERYIYDVMLDGVRYNCAMKQLRFVWHKNIDAHIQMLGLLYPKNDVGVFQR